MASVLARCLEFDVVLSASREGAPAAPRRERFAGLAPARDGARGRSRGALARGARFRRGRRGRSEERRVGKSVDLGGRRIIKKKNRTVLDEMGSEIGAMVHP